MAATFSIGNDLLVICMHIQIILDMDPNSMTVHDSMAHINEGPESGTITIDDNGHHGQNKAESITRGNFFVPKCSACKYEMTFSEGDIIYGDKWYHSNCWKEIQSLVEIIS